MESNAKQVVLLVRGLDKATKLVKLNIVESLLAG